MYEGFEAEIQKHHQSAYSDNFTLIERLLPEKIRDIRERLRDRVVIDVGGGEGEAMAKFAHDAGASRYINVDIVPHVKGIEKYPAEYVTGDIMSYLSDPKIRNSFKSGANFIVNGLDAFVSSIVPEEFVGELIAYMKQGDYVFGLHAPEIEEELSATPWFEKIHYKDSNVPFFIFRKK